MSLTTDDVALLKGLLEISVGEASRRALSNGWILRAATVSTEWLGFGPVFVTPDGNDPTQDAQTNLPHQGLAGCDNFLTVGTRVMTVHVPPSGMYVIGRPNGSSDPWREIGTFDVSAIGTGWAYDPTYTDTIKPSIKRAGGLVVFAGAMYRTSASGSDINLLLLPPAYTPKNRVRLTMRGTNPITNSHSVYLDVLPTGYVVWAGGAVGQTAFDPTGQGTVFLDQLTFALG